LGIIVGGMVVDSVRVFKEVKNIHMNGSNIATEPIISTACIIKLFFFVFILIITPSLLY